jgi:hypothetical protein
MTAHASTGWYGGGGSFNIGIVYKPLPYLVQSLSVIELFHPLSPRSFQIIIMSSPVSSRNSRASSVARDGLDTSSSSSSSGKSTQGSSITTGSSSSTPMSAIMRKAMSRILREEHAATASEREGPMPLPTSEVLPGYKSGFSSLDSPLTPTSKTGFSSPDLGSEFYSIPGDGLRHRGGAR